MKTSVRANADCRLPRMRNRNPASVVCGFVRQQPFLRDRLSRQSIDIVSIPYGGP